MLYLYVNVIHAVISTYIAIKTAHSTRHEIFTGFYTFSGQVGLPKEHPVKPRLQPSAPPFMLEEAGEARHLDRWDVGGIRNKNGFDSW